MNDTHFFKTFRFVEQRYLFDIVTILLEETITFVIL